MTFEGAVVKEQGVKFAVVVVKRHVIDNRSEANQMIASMQHQVFGGLPVVLMAQDSRGAPSYYGRQDIAKFLANVPMQAIPWKRYTIQ